MTRDESFILRKSARVAHRATYEALWALRNMLDNTQRAEVQHAQHTVRRAIEALRAAEEAAQKALPNLQSYVNDNDNS